MQGGRGNSRVVVQHVEGAGQPTWVAVLSSPSVCRYTVLCITMQDRTRTVHCALDAYYAMLVLDKVSGHQMHDTPDISYALCRCHLQLTLCVSPFWTASVRTVPCRRHRRTLAHARPPARCSLQATRGETAPQASIACQESQAQLAAESGWDFARLLHLGSVRPLATEHKLITCTQLFCCALTAKLRQATATSTTAKCKNVRCA